MRQLLPSLTGKTPLNLPVRGDFPFHWPSLRQLLPSLTGKTPLNLPVRGDFLFHWPSMRQPLPSLTGGVGGGSVRGGSVGGGSAGPATLLIGVLKFYKCLSTKRILHICAGVFEYKTI